MASSLPRYVQIRALDRPGGRSLLAGIASLRMTLERRAPAAAYWRDGKWIHRWPEGTLVLDELTWSVEQWIGQTELDVFFRHYRPRGGDIVVDVGAGVGSEVFLLAGLVGETGKIYAIEAHPGTFAELSDLVALNGWDRGRVCAFNLAVSDRNGVATISDDSSIEANIMNGNRTFNVESVTIDSFVSRCGIDRIDWLKMNIEGAEKMAVAGMESSAGIIRNLCISCHDFIGNEAQRSKREVRKWMVGAGFHVEEHVDTGRAWSNDYLYGWR